MSTSPGPSASFARDFGPFEGTIWMNCAHQGPLPRVAVRAACRELERKIRPSEIDDESFHAVPDRLRRVLGRLVGAPAGEIVLGDSASHGLHLLANGLPWRDRDEVLLVRGDFPATLLPWLRLRQAGVRVRWLAPGRGGPTPAGVEAAIGSRTRAVCVSWVDSFTGHAIDLRGIGEVCRDRGVLFLVNGSQGVGSRRLDVGTTPVDALTCCGYKWLCGPYGTGFLWVRSPLLEELECDRTYWLPLQRGRPLDDMRGLVERGDPLREYAALGAPGYDVFGTARFLDFVPWSRALEYLLDVGLERIEAWNATLVDRLVHGLVEAGFEVSSPRAGPRRSCLVVFSHPTADRNEALVRRLKRARIHVSLREGRIRVSPHLYNTLDEVERVLDVLGRVGGAIGPATTG